MRRFRFRNAAVILPVLLTAMLHSCATAGSTSMDYAAINQTLDTWRTAMMAKDLAGIMATHSDHYSQDGKDRKAIEAFYRTAIEEKDLDNAIVVTEHATIAIDGDTALVSPIAVSKPTGSGSLRLRLAREANGWRIVGMEWP